MMAKHFCDIKDFPKEELQAIIDKAISLKSQIKAGASEIPLLKGKILACIYEKPSTRTRISFEVAMRRLGGQCFFLSGGEMQFGRGETVADTAKILSLMVDAVMIRTDYHEKIIELCENSTIPVINGLTDDTHPCQVLAGAMMIQENFGDISNTHIAWIGDGNNVANSWIQLAIRYGMKMTVCTPIGYEPKDLKLAMESQFKINLEQNAQLAAKNADVIITDTWVSMNHTDRPKRLKDFQDYQITDKIMKNANKNAVFSHCLPAHRGEEVLASVIDGEQSRVWQEAENRIFVQMAILLYCFEIKG